MDPSLGGQQPVRVPTIDRECGTLDACLVTGRDLDELDLETPSFGPSLVETQEDLRPILRIGAALPRVDLEDRRIVVELTTEEMDEWRSLTSRIRQNAWRSKGGSPDDYLSKLLRDRRALLETAAGKICAATKDHAEGLAAANERRPPRFIGA